MLYISAVYLSLTRYNYLLNHEKLLFLVFHPAVTTITSYITQIVAEHMSRANTDLANYLVHLLPLEAICIERVCHQHGYRVGHSVGHTVQDGIEEVCRCTAIHMVPPGMQTLEV